jgi:hypothetical protein
LISFFRHFDRIPALLASEEKQLLLFWKMMKKHLERKKYFFGIYENEKTLRAEFKVEEDLILNFDYSLHQTRLYLVCESVECGDDADASDLFILAQHMNNFIPRDGKIHIDTREQRIALAFNVDFRLYLLGLLDVQEIILRHYHITLDARKCFQRLIREGTDPVEIIADLLAEDDAYGENSPG